MTGLLRHEARIQALGQITTTPGARGRNLGRVFAWLALSWLVAGIVWGLAAQLL